MGLREYYAKRDFDQTPEPRGGRKAAGEKALRFVVQKHAASRLHYDFRLEMDGVLKSWAVPKGPSMNPADRRLAIQTEDHPLDYRDFEGIIPQGNYGAGTVMVWDEGVYWLDSEASRAEDEQDLLAGLKKGHLRFTVNGRKLKGTFHLVRTDGSDNQWLLMKADDADAGPIDITAEDRSVLTGRNLAEIAAGKERVWSSDRLPEIALDPALQAPMPDQPAPMLATAVDAPFDRPGWLFEIKWDGYRALAHIRPAQVALYSRNLISFNDRFPLIVRDLEQLRSPCILDGELVALDANGRPSFDHIKHYERHQDAIYYYVFDILYWNGHNLRTVPLRRRKEILKAILPDSLPRVRYCDHIETFGTDFFKIAQRQGLEGIMAKDGDSLYISGKRAHTWLKIRNKRRQEGVIIGFTAPRGSRKELGALILAAHDGNRLRYIGHTGTGMDGKTLKMLRQKLDPLITDEKPVSDTIDSNARPTWVKPVLVCDVEYTEFTADGRLRHPVFAGLRDDKRPDEVVVEKEEKAARAVQEAEAEDAAQAATPVILPIRHPDKLFFPEKGLTKGDVARYYAAIAPVILPYLKDRPIVLNRFPDGIHGESFYQKDYQQEIPPFLQVTAIYSKSNRKNIHYMLCQNVESLLYLVNLGCIDINPWNSRTQHLEHPDWLVMDLDPEAIGPEAIMETALTVKAVLDELGVMSYPKTSGATGMHIYVPLNARYHYDQVRDFANLMAMLVHQRLPKITSLERSPSKRQGKVYLDYLQNRYGQIMASPYSLRPRTSAGVSTPLRWEEVYAGLDPEGFDIHAVLERVKSLGDLWQGMLDRTTDLEAALRRLETT